MASMTTNESYALSTASERCDAAVTRRSLLQHPFYLAWSDGTLPIAALQDYARDYGAFIRTVGSGWETVGETHLASVEEGHAEVWQTTFAAGLDTQVDVAQVPAVAALVDTARALFAEPVTALGALYAFESQQPFTAQSKLAGLKEHYAQLPACCGEYFRLHEDDFEEPALLAARLNSLPPSQEERAVASCERMSQSLYDALTGLHAPYCAA
jgi:pyrroloquinoline-quinone synthase